MPNVIKLRLPSAPKKAHHLLTEKGGGYFFGSYMLSK